MKYLNEADRLLVEKAASRAEIEITWSPEYQQHFRKGAELGQRLFWNPLADDGDAFRLAVICGLRVKYHAVLGQALVVDLLQLEFTANVEEHNRDPYATTRRAITIAAAYHQ